MNFKKGFTLIELLVVVAIIGILASVVLASLNTARSKGSDASIKADLDGMRAEAAIFYDTGGVNGINGTAQTYAGGTGVVAAATTCPTSFTANNTTNYNLFGDSTFYGAINQAFTQSGISTAGNCSYVNTASGWAVAVTLKTANTSVWCVDSSGNSKSETTAANTASAAYTAATTTCI